MAGLMTRFAVVIVLCMLTCAASGQSVRVIDSLPSDWEGTITQAYDIRILDVSDDGRTMVGFVSSGNCHDPISTNNGSGGGVVEDIHISRNTQASLMEPFVIRDGVMRYLPVPSMDGLVSGYANRVSADGLTIWGARHIGTVLLCPTFPPSWTMRKYEAVSWNLDGLPTLSGIPDSQPVAVTSDGAAVLLMVDNLVTMCLNQWVTKSVLLQNGVSVWEDDLSTPVAMSDSGADIVTYPVRWEDQVDDYIYLAISGSGEVRFGFEDAGCLAPGNHMVRLAGGAHTQIGTTDCMWSIGASSFDGQTALIRGSATGTQWVQARVWTEEAGVQSVESYFDQFGMNVRPWVYAGTPMVLTNLNGDATVFVGFLRGGENYGGGGPDRAIIIDTRAPCPADFAGPDGVLNFFDVAAFLAAYNGQDTAADLAAPFGVFNIFDVQAYIGLYTQGCP